MKPGRKKGGKNSVKKASKIIKNYKEKLKEKNEGSSSTASNR